ncbi:MAG: S8 family serine peptidase [Saprospiraceae bacterium]
MHTPRLFVLLRKVIFSRSLQLLTSCILSFSMFGQQSADMYVIRYSDDLQVTNSGSIASILSSHSATLEVTYTEATTPGLLSWRTLNCSSCDKVEVLDELMGTGEFIFWYQNYGNVASECGDCPNPDPITDPLVNGSQGFVQQDTMDYLLAENTSWQITSTGAACAWPLTDNSIAPFAVAVVDTEIDEDHPDLVGRVEEVWRYTDSNGIPCSCTASHGTQVTSIIVAGINNGIGTSGVCDVCTVDNYVVPNRDIPWNIGIIAAINDGQRVINASRYWRNQPDGSIGLALIDIIEAVEAAGAILVLSTSFNATRGNNQNAPQTQTTPGIIVVATTVILDDGRINEYWKNLDGPTVDLLAPGRFVVRALNPDLNGGREYGIGQGGSLAQPFVAAAAGMLLHSFPCLSPGEVEDLIVEGADADCLIWHNPNRHGGGHLNIAQSLSLAAAAVAANQDPVIISDVTTITDETIYYNNNLIVTGGGNLVVSNSTLRFAEGYGIIVEEDGGFTAFGSTFENNPCKGEYWSGISTDGNAFIKGNVNSPPGAYLLGSTVRNARTGVKDFGQSFRAHNKGAISVVSSVFENCLTSIASSDPDQAPDITYNTIRVDDDYPHAVQEHIGVKLTYGDPGQVTQLGSNVFEDLRSNKEVGGTAISVVDASFNVGTAVGPAGNAGGATTITGYLHGIKAFQGGLKNHLATVRGCESYNTTVSAWLIGYNNPQVINNTFEAMSEDIYMDRYADPIPVQGIRIEFCRRHTVEGNTVNAAQLGFAKTYGVVVIGDLVTATRDAVYNNTLNGCNYGMLALEENGGTDNISGLCYECNTFNGCEEDIRAKGTIASFQIGRETGGIASAGNVFESLNMQFASEMTLTTYFGVNQNEQPNPSFQVTAATTQNSNSCLPISGVAGGEEPPCEDVDVVALDVDRQTVKDYFQSGTTSEEQALIALAEYNRKYVMYAREYIDEVDGCENGSVVEWENTIKTAAPWEPLDETLVEVYQGDFVSAGTKLQGLVGLIGPTEVSRLSTMLSLAEDVQASSTDGELAAAFTTANLTAFLSESELNQSYSQGLARAAAASYGLSNYEARLPEPSSDDEGGNADDIQSLVLPTPFELQDVRIFDALGRQVVSPNTGTYLTIEGLNQSLSTQPSGIYYIRGSDDQGLIQTVSVSNVK